MSSSKTYFLKFNSTDKTFYVVDENNFAFGDGDTATEAIQSARIVLDETDPIIYGDKLAMLSKAVGKTGEEESIYTSLESLAIAMAELSGFKIYKVFDDYLEHIGYSMELIE